MLFFGKYVRRSSVLMSLFFCVACSTAPAAVPTPIVTEPPAMTATVAPATATMPPSDTATPVATATPEPPKNLVWQDTFDNQDSGWEPHFVVDNLATYYKNERLVASNGYNNSTYQFVLPVNFVYRSIPAPFLWDFNTAHPLPDYPYQIDLRIHATPTGNPLLVLDFQGDVNKIGAGSGVAITWNMHEANVYKNLTKWPFVAYEFRGNHTWKLGCSGKIDTGIDGIDSTIRAVVNSDTVVLTFGSDTTIQCTRQHKIDSTKPRILGLGAVLAQGMVPIIAQNSLQYDDLVVTKPTDVPADQHNFAAKEVMNIGCHNFQDDQSTEPINLPTLIASNVDCADQYYGFSSGFTGFGHTRLATPAQPELLGHWSCGSADDFANFSLAQEKDYLNMTIAGQRIVVFYAKKATGDGVNDGNDGYIVTYRGPAGGTPSMDSRDFAQVGDGIGSPIDYHYYFTYANNQITTNWTAQPCTKTS